MSEKLKSGEHQNKFEELKDFEIKEHSKEALSEANHEKAIDSALKKVHESSKVDETERLKDSFDGEDDDVEEEEEEDNDDGEGFDNDVDDVD